MSIDQGILFIIGMKVDGLVDKHPGHHTKQSVESTIENVSHVFKQCIGFTVKYYTSVTCEELHDIMIQDLRQAESRHQYNIIGFYFIGNGKLAVNGEPCFVTPVVFWGLQDITISIQKEILNPIRNAKNDYPHQKFMFFFDCCFGQDSHTSDKPFAFDFPPNCVVAFSTSPGKCVADHETKCTSSIWNSEFCKQLEAVQKGHTLTDVFDATTGTILSNPKYIKCPPQYHSCVGPIALKGIDDELLKRFIEKKDSIKDVLDVIDKETKQMALDRGAHFLVETLIKICRENPIYTEIIVEKMKGEEKLSHIMEAVETQKAAAPERCLSYKDRLDTYEKLIKMNLN